MQSEFLLQRETTKHLEFGRQTDPVFRPHFHSHIEIYLINSGQLDVCINNDRKTLTAGEISISLSYDIHAYDRPVNADTFFVIIPPHFFKDFMPILSNRRNETPFIKDKETYDTVRYSLEKLIEGRQNMNEIAKRGYIYVILGTILSQIPDKKSSETQDSLFSPDILIYISKHFKEKLSLSSLAANFGYNASYLSRSFNQTFGISFNKYIKMIRLREAVILLNKGNSITDCALESGFGSLRSFYRAFQEEFGCSPKEYLNMERPEKNE